jgi:gamma-glutamyltranspeptidase/glutathione hydrolase
MKRRPLILATKGLITSGHYLATAAGYRVALMGGNAIDIAATVCFCLNLVENQNCGLGGEVPALIYSAKEKKTFAVSGLGWNASAFTIDWCREHGLDMIPGDGFLPALVPSVVGTWGAAVERFGRLSFAQILHPIIELAEQGYPVYEGLFRVLTHQKEKFTKRYPTTGKLFLPEGRVPQIGERMTNPDLANTLKIMVKAESEQSNKGRSAGIQAAVNAFYQGPIAEQIVRFIQDHSVEDDSGQSHTGLLSYSDIAGWQARIEEPLSFIYEGLVVNKCNSWTQGPVFLQQLAILSGFDLKHMGLNSVDYIHTILESSKLAFADREAYYGDPLFDKPPFDVLLSPIYNEQRRRLITSQASMTLQPGDAGGGLPAFDINDVRGSNRLGLGFDAPQGSSGLPGHAGDTTHLDVVDAEGNMVAATPSGGWISSSPVIAGLGFPLGTRGQMFYLDPERPNALAPHKRPRATLTPSLVTRNGEPLLAFGMRGGDVQDQKTLQLFLAHVEFGLDVQAALDVPSFHSESFPSSFTPRHVTPGLVVIEDRLDEKVIEGLQKRGHIVRLNADVRENMMAVRLDPDTKVMSGGVCSSGEHAYALGWS